MDQKGRTWLPLVHIKLCFYAVNMNCFCIIDGLLRYQETIERQLEVWMRGAWEIIWVMPSVSPSLSIPLSVLHTDNNGCTFDLQLAGTNRCSNLQTAATQKPRVDRNIKSLQNCSIFDENIATCCIHVSIVLRTRKGHRQLYQTSHPISYTAPWLRRLIQNSVQSPSTKNITFRGRTSFSLSVFFLFF